MSTHTPGPWTAEAWNCHARTTVRAGDVTIECSGHGRMSHECEVDAALIASLPQLLEASQYALDVLHDAQISKQRRQHAKQLLQAALVAPALEERAQ